MAAARHEDRPCRSPSSPACSAVSPALAQLYRWTDADRHRALHDRARRIPAGVSRQRARHRRLAAPRGAAAAPRLGPVQIPWPGGPPIGDGAAQRRRAHPCSTPAPTGRCCRPRAMARAAAASAGRTSPHPRRDRHAVASRFPFPAWMSPAPGSGRSPWSCMRSRRRASTACWAATSSTPSPSPSTPRAASATLTPR